MAVVSKIHVMGFRNFKDSTVNLTAKALIIGANDVGKTNLVYAMRLLLDRTLSEADIEPSDADFYAHEPTNSFSITLTVTGVTEDCIIAKMKENISDDGTLILRYQAQRDPASKQKSFRVFAGQSEADLHELQARVYLRVLNLRYIGGRRDLAAYIKRERRQLLEDAREARTDAQKTSDAVTYGSIDEGLKAVTAAVVTLSYVKAAAEGVNAELAELSHHHLKQEVAFDAAPADPSQFVDGVEIVSRVRGKNLPLTGDGRANQVQFALWAARENTDPAADVLEVGILCIEEPEAHLHPHQQRRLAAYLANKFHAQVVMTSHSPQIACEFPAGSIVRLYDSDAGTRVAGNGCSPIIETAIVDFSYRMGLIPAEALFASAVLLVEGPSEQMFFEAFAPAIGVDLDRLNLSVLAVNGVGFVPYADLLTSLSIPFAVRTDNDVFAIPNSNPKTFRAAGAERCVEICEAFRPDMSLGGPPFDRRGELRGFSTPAPPDRVVHLIDQMRPLLAAQGVFLAHDDLEWDVWSAMSVALSAHYGSASPAAVVPKMQEAKGENMFTFLRACEAGLRPEFEAAVCHPLTQAAASLAAPLDYLRKLVEGP